MDFKIFLDPIWDLALKMVSKFVIPEFRDTLLVPKITKSGDLLYLIFELRICWPISIADWVLGFTAACSFLWIGRWLQVWIVPLMSLIWRLYYKASILSTTLWLEFQNCVQKFIRLFFFEKKWNMVCYGKIHQQKIKISDSEKV